MEPKGPGMSPHSISNFKLHYKLRLFQFIPPKKSIQTKNKLLRFYEAKVSIYVPKSL